MNNNTYNNGDINSYAATMLNQIKDCVNSQTHSLPHIVCAIVKNVNDDGSVDVTLPPNNDTIFTRIPNETHFELFVGDSIEILLKNGSLSNCWVCAKHGISKNKEKAITKTDVEDIVKSVLKEYGINKTQNNSNS